MMSKKDVSSFIVYTVTIIIIVAIVGGALSSHYNNIDFRDGNYYAQKLEAYDKTKSATINLIAAGVVLWVVCLIAHCCFRFLASQKSNVEDKYDPEEPPKLFGYVMYNLGNVWQPTMGNTPHEYWIKEAFRHLYVLKEKYPDAPETWQATEEYKKVKKQIRDINEQESKKEEQKKKLETFFRKQDKKRRKKIRSVKVGGMKEWFINVLKRWWPLYVKEKMMMKTKTIVLLIGVAVLSVLLCGVGLAFYIYRNHIDQICTTEEVYPASAVTRNGVVFELIDPTAPEHWRSYKGIEWGTDISNNSDFVLETDRSNDESYNKYGIIGQTYKLAKTEKPEEPSLGRMKVVSLECYRNLLYSVEESNVDIPYRDMVNAFILRYGEPYLLDSKYKMATGPRIYTLWKKYGVKIHITSNSEFSPICEVRYTYVSLQKKEDEEGKRQEKQFRNNKIKKYFEQTKTPVLKDEPKPVVLPKKKEPVITKAPSSATKPNIDLKEREALVAQVEKKARDLYKKENANKNPYGLRTTTVRPQSVVSIAYKGKPVNDRILNAILLGRFPFERYEGMSVRDSFKMQNDDRREFGKPLKQPYRYTYKERKDIHGFNNMGDIIVYHMRVTDPMLDSVSYYTYKGIFYKVTAKTKEKVAKDYLIVLTREYGEPVLSSLHAGWNKNNLVISYCIPPSYGHNLSVGYTPVVNQIKQDNKNKKQRDIDSAVKAIKLTPEQKQKLAEKVEKMRKQRLEDEKKRRKEQAEMKKIERPITLLKMAKMLIENDSFISARRNLNTIIKDYPKSLQAEEAKKILKDIEEE